MKLRTPIAYKLKDGYVWALVSAKPYWKRLYYNFTPNDKVVPFNQMFGENGTPFYAELGMKGHNGIDYYAPDNTALFAIYDGYISWVNDPIGGDAYTDGYGGMLQLNFTADDKKYLTTYAHMQDVFVKQGQQVGAGQLLGLSDNTGKYTTGSHLHIGLCPLNNDGQRKDPNNGYMGYIDHYPYLLDKEIHKLNDVEELYWYAASKGKEPIDYYVGFFGSAHFNQAKKELGITSSVDFGNVYDYAIFR